MFAADSTSKLLTLGDNAFATLQSLSDLETLSLWGTTVEDADLTKFKSLKKLISIDLSYTKVTGNSLQILKRLPNLQLINLEGCNVEDEQLKHLRGFERLITLRLAKTQVTDDGLVEIARLKKLNHLDLSSCAITDEGLRSLGEFPQLQHLWLSKTVRYGIDDTSDITDASVEYLSTLKSLIDLRIADSKLSAAGLARLRKSLPSATVSTESSGVTYIIKE